MQSAPKNDGVMVAVRASEEEVRAAMQEVLHKAVAHKAAVVAQDPTEWMRARFDRTHLVAERRLQTVERRDMLGCRELGGVGW